MQRNRIIVAGVALALAACTNGGPGAQDGPATLEPDDIVLASALQPFDACDDLLDYFQQHALEVVGPWGLPGSGGPDMLDMARAEASQDDAAGAAPPAPAAGAPVEGVDYSGTNVQEKGVDEPDILKTDGRIVVTVAQNRLQIVDLDRPGRIAATLGVDGWGHELLLDGDRLLVMATGDGQGVPVAADRAMSPGPYTSSPVSVLTLVDLSDPADPRVEAELTLDGGYRSARMVDGTARVVLTSQPTGLVFTYPEGGGLRAERAATEANRDVIRDSTIDNWLPYYVLEDRRSGDVVTSEGTLLECSGVSRPQDFSGLGLLSVLSVDLGGSLEPSGGTAVVASGETVYASRSTLYVTTTEWFDPAAVQDPRGPVDEDYSTSIHAFDITDPATATYVASGTVRGHLLNQFSLSEHDGRLRVATTDGTPWQESTESFVTVLQERDGVLRRVGQVGDLGRGERIYAVRFLGDTGYVVTFRQTDPLYTVDLSDPAEPRVTGELKILGYSAYLHPLGDGRLLGVGQDATAEGRTTGTQLSLFDVSDPAAPTRIAQHRVEGASSDVEWDHRAFLYWPATELAVLPLSWYRYSENGQSEDFWSGARAFTVGRDSLEPAGRVQHPSSGPEGMWMAAIRRTAVVGDALVTLSELGLMTSDLRSLEQRTFAAF